MSHPTISCVMSVYNGESYLLESINSILAQSYPDFELIIIDDASTDSTSSILRSVSDSRIKLYTNPLNIGLTKSLNRGLNLAKGKYIARMDADDVSFLNRFEKQFLFLESNRRINLVADLQQGTYGVKKTLKSDEIDVELLFHNCISHSSVMFRRIIDKQAVKYDEFFLRTQDYALWTSRYFRERIGFVGKKLVEIRRHANQISQQSREEQISYQNIIQKKLITDLGMEVSSDELTLHQRIGDVSPGYSQHFFIEAVNWMQKLVVANNKTNVYNNGVLIKRLRAYLKRFLLSKDIHLSSRSLLLKQLLFNNWNNVV